MAKKSHVLIISALTIVCAFLVYDRWNARVAARTSDERVSALAASVEALQGREPSELHVIERVPTGPAAPVEQLRTVDSSAPPQSESPPTDRGENGDPSASLLVRRAELADKFKNQDRDPRWTPTAERTLRGEVRNLVSDSKRVLALECGSSMCRIDAEFSSAEDYNEFWTNLFLHRDDERLKDIYGGFEIPESEKHEDGSYRVRAYMMRAPAGPLPNPPPP